MTNNRPERITQSEYDTIWKPQGWKLLIIGPTSTWRQEWGMWEGIRDIVQNCLDETEKYYYGYDKDGLYIQDYGKGMAVADFLLGPPKLKPAWARGKFGEGMKIAALTFLRNEYPVHVETVNRDVWVVFLEQEINGYVKTLAALWKADGLRLGTTFHICGYRGTAFENNFAVNLPRTLILAQVPSTLTKPQQRYNQLIKAEGPARNPDGGGIIYCRDIFLQPINSKFSYNLWSFELAPDRHGPMKESAMWEDIGRLWSGVSDVSLMAEFIAMVTDPPKHKTDETNRVSLAYLGDNPVRGKRYADIMVENKGSWQQAWTKVCGRDAVIATTEGLSAMVTHLGYRPVGVQWSVRSMLSIIIKTDSELVQEMGEKLRMAGDIPDRELQDKQRAHLELARAIAEDFPGISFVKAAVIPAASDMVTRTAGVYEFDTHGIKIHVQELDSGEHTMGVMVHEIGHHVAWKETRDQPTPAERAAKAGDLTKEHEDAMERVVGIITRNLAQGKYDKYLAKVIW